MRLDHFKQVEDSPSVPLAAMIDVLFLMIIFLVLGANFDPVASVQLPQASGGAVSEGVLRLELRADGLLWLEGQPLGEEKIESILRQRTPRSVLLLPDGGLNVETLFRWYDRLSGATGLPVSVGVRPPAP